jgi:hypothetical protein
MSLDEFKKKLIEEVEKSLKKDVYDVVKAVEKRKIFSEVYGKYSQPKDYVRRYNDDGLVADSNIIQNTNTNGNTSRLEVSNITEYNKYWGGRSAHLYHYLTPLIILGHYGHMSYTGDYLDGGYSWYPYPRYFADAYAEPRDFIKATKDELKMTKAHVYALEKSLSSKGIKVK